MTDIQRRIVKMLEENSGKSTEDEAGIVRPENVDSHVIAKTCKEILSFFPDNSTETI